MASRETVAIFSFLLVISMALGTHAISCFECDYNLEENCKDPFNQADINIIEDCETCEKIYIESNNGKSWIRGCVKTDSKEKCVESAETKGNQTINMYCCNTDKCNSAPKWTISILTLICLIVTVLV